MNEKAKRKKHSNKELNILDVLLDEENDDLIPLFDDKGHCVPFMQVAVIPRDEELYCILKPMEKVKGIKDDEALVFKVDDSGEDPTVSIVRDELMAIEIFEKYLDLCESVRKKKKNLN